jgi:lipopolysaccharide transport system ATP-binding protein
MTEVAKGGRTVVFVSHNMQPVRALCERALLLQGGRLVDDGDTDSVVRRYLASVDASETGRHRWADPGNRPGNDACRLVEVRVADESGEPTATFFSSQPIDVHYELDVHVPDPGLVVVLDLVTSDGTTVFRSYSTDAGGAGQLGAQAGMRAVRCRIPSGFLNGGRYLVNVRVHLRGIDGIVNEQGVLQFDVTADHGESYFITPVHGRPGVVAPVLDWQLTEASSEDDTLGEPAPATAAR